MRDKDRADAPLQEIPTKCPQSFGRPSWLAHRIPHFSRHGLARCAGPVGDMASRLPHGALTSSSVAGGPRTFRLPVVVESPEMSTYQPGKVEDAMTVKQLIRKLQHPPVRTHRRSADRIRGRWHLRGLAGYGPCIAANQRSRSARQTRRTAEAGQKGQAALGRCG
jgi:hypothetical protein